MAVTEEARVSSDQNQLEERKKWLKQVIDTSGRYERLLAVHDFQEVVRDLFKVMEIHDREIKNYVKFMSNEESPFRRLRFESVIMKHQIRRDQIEEAVTYPEKIVQAARSAREELIKIKQQEEASHAARNGTED